jgi:hypothetical protein
LLENFNARLGRKTFSNKHFGVIVYKTLGKDNGVKTVNFATSKNLIDESTIFPHHIIHKFI